MFERLTAMAVTRWPLVLALTALFCVIGWNRFQSLPIEAFPDVTDPMVEVVGLYPGQAAEEVERRVTVELERVLAGTPGLIDLRSVSVFGLSLVTLTFDEGTDDFRLRALVAERLRDAELPEGAEAIMGPQATPVGQIYRYTLAGPRSLRDLRELQDFVVERRLASVPGVAEVVTFGGFQRQFQVRVDPARLASAGVSLEEVYDALARSNSNAGGGYVGVGSQDLVVRALGAIDSPEELGLAVVRDSDGVPVRIRDVAEVVEGSTPRRGAVGRGLNDEVVEGIVLLRRGENPSVVLEALKERVRLLNEEILPPDVQIVPFYDRQELVDATLATVGTNLAEGALLVLLLVYLFLRTLRAVLIVAVVIPVSMLSAFVGLSAMGLPANLISLGAIDFGILVDGAIIVLEASLHALAHRRKDGPPATDTIRAAATSVARPVGFSMLIIIVALAPVFLLERVEGRIFAPMAWTYAFALLGALVSAVLVVPALEAALMRRFDAPPSPRWLEWMADRYAGGLRRLAAARRASMGLFAAGLVALIGTAAGIGSEFLPELNEGGYYITAVFPSTVSLDETRRQVTVMRKRILESPEVVDVLSHIGRPEEATQAEGPNNAEIFVALAPEKEWRPGLDRVGLEAELRQRLEEIPGVQYNFSQPITDRVFETISGIIGQVVVKVRGSDLERLTEAAEEIRQALAPVEGITDLAMYQAGEIPSLRIELDRAALAQRGLAVEDVQRTVRVALGGEVATELWQDERRFAVALRLPDAVRANPEALGRLMVGDPARGVTLGEVARIETAQGRASIWREDFTRFVAVKFNVRGRDLGSTVAEAQERVKALSLGEGVYVTWGGEFQNQHRAMARLAVTVPLALLAIVGILFWNFGRWRPTLSILLFLPAAVLGGLAGLRVLGENFSVSAAVGCIALLGQMVLAGVMLCSRIDQAREAGSPSSMLEGAREAFRPVLLTTALALLGLVPAATSHAMGSETQRPFAIAIVSGLLIGTPALLMLLPLVYAGRRGSASAADGESRRERTAEEAGASRAVARVVTSAMLALLVFIAPASAGASQPGGFSLEEALALMQEAHPRIAAARAREAAAGAEITAAGLWENPELVADYVHAVREPSYDPIGAVVFGVEQQLELSGLPGARKDAARAEARATSAERAEIERLLALEVERSFVALAAQDRLLTVLDEQVERLARAASIIQARVAEGAASRYEGRRIRAALAEAEAERRDAAADREMLRAELDVAVGPLASKLTGSPRYDVATLPELPALESLLERLPQERLDLAAAQARMQAREAEVEVARRSVFRGVNVRLGGGYGQGPGQVDVGLGLSVPLPVLDRGQGSIDAAAQRVSAARQDVDALLLAAQQRLAGAWRAASQRIAAAREFREQTRSIGASYVEEAEAAWREGRLSVLELVDVFTSAREVHSRELALARDAHLAWLGVRRALISD